MSKLSEALAALRRPRLLIRAARHGAAEYNRNRDLKRVMRFDALPGPSVTVARLMDLEAEAETVRKSGASTYSPARHVDILIALIGESRLLT